MSYNDGFGGSPTEFNYKNSEYNQIEEMRRASLYEQGYERFERQLAAAFEGLEKLKIASQELNDVVNEIKTISQTLKLKL